MLKKLFRGMFVLLALVGAWSVLRFLFWPPSATLYEGDDWVVLQIPAQSSNCVVMDHLGAPIADWPMETLSDSGVHMQKTDAAGRGAFVSFGNARRSVALLPTGHDVAYWRMGLTVFIKK